MFYRIMPHNLATKRMCKPEDALDILDAYVEKLQKEHGGCCEHFREGLNHGFDDVRHQIHRMRSNLSDVNSGV